VPICCHTLLADVPPVIEEIPQDTARAVTNLLYTGTVAQFREIRFIFCHGGGTLPMVYGRMLQNPPKNLAERSPNGVDYELRKLYYDVAATAVRPAMAALTSLVPTSQILLGTDNPYVPAENTVRALRQLGFSAAELRAIGRDNALGLPPGLKL
jgi:predicted TIM-barrel fold metal-dependent hydrolase